MLIRKNYKQKLLVVLVSFFGLYAIIIFRLFLIQIYQRDFFTLLAKQQYVTEITTQPPRALIYDRTGTPLVLNRERLSAFILPHRFHESIKTKKLLKDRFPKVYKRLLKDKRRRFLWLERHLTPERLKKIKLYESPDIYFLAEPERFYPFPAASHVIGFTDIDNVGISGTELQFNKIIGGTPTTFILEKDARSNYFYFRKDIKEQGEQGLPVTLTLDRNLQFFACKELEKAVKKHGAKDGAVLILDPMLGEVLAMASYPGQDEGFTKNIPVTECFELGSVIKVFTALSALEEGVVTPDEQIDCEGKMTYIDGFRVENWKSLGSGTHPFWEVVARSNNVGIAKVAKRLGPKLYHHLQRLGFGKLTDIRFPGERSGFVNPPRNWSRSSLIVLSFGYEIMATLLQLGRAFSIIANGGNNVQMQLVAEPERKQHSLLANRLYQKETIDQMKDILEIKGWVKDKYSIDGYRIMGKTGTARSVKDGRYSSKDHVYTYAGIIEKLSDENEKRYKRVIITFINQPKKAHMWASQVTLPLFHSVAQKMIVYDLGKGEV
jgi:cell division protein FtsI (penicillin-binding protein 3)